MKIAESKKTARKRESENEGTSHRVDYRTMTTTMMMIMMMMMMMLEKFLVAAYFLHPSSRYPDTVVFVIVFVE